MLKFNRDDLLFNRTTQIYFFLILCFCILSESLIAKPLPLINMDKEKSAAPLQNVKIDDEVELLKYVKELQVQSQIIAKDYFYISQGLREDKARLEIKESAWKIDNILNILTSSIKNEEMQNLLSYLNEINMESKSIFNDSFSNENASLVIDYSETLYEGSLSIIDFLSKGKKSINSLHDDILYQQLVLQRINKFYIAYQIGFNDESMFRKLEEAVNDFQRGLNQICSHEFVNEEQEFTSIRLKNYWSISKKFYEGMEKGELTLIVFVSTDHMMSYLNKMLNYEQ